MESNKFGILSNKTHFRAVHNYRQIPEGGEVEYVKDLINGIKIRISENNDEISTYFLNPLLHITNSENCALIFLILKDFIHNSQSATKKYISPIPLILPIIIECLKNKEFNLVKIKLNHTEKFINGIEDIDNFWRELLSIPYVRARLGNKWSLVGNAWLIKALFNLFTGAMHPSQDYNVSKKASICKLSFLLEDKIEDINVFLHNENFTAGKFYLILDGHGHFEKNAFDKINDDSRPHDLSDQLRVIMNAVDDEPTLYHLKSDYDINTVINGGLVVSKFSIFQWDDLNDKKHSIYINFGG